MLVHGAWHGAWCWKRVAGRLLAAGHAVFAPTLTGLSDRAHLLSPAVDLDTHITDVINLLEAEELADVLLVGHSYAGMVVTGVADRAAGRLRGLVYVDAFLPENGGRLLDYAPPERREAMVREGQASGRVAPPPAALLGLAPGTRDFAWVTRRMTPHPYGTLEQPLHLRGDGGARLPRTYVHCSSPPTGNFAQFAAMARHAPGWRFHELRTGHDSMVTDPEGTVRAILESA